MPLWVVFFALFMLCAGISIIFLIYICILWYASLGQPPLNNNNNTNANVDNAGNHKSGKKGLTESELEEIPGVEEGGVVKGVECAVCLDEIEEGQVARVLPDCRHAFHRSCADAWLSGNAVCPLCRTQLLVPPPPIQPHHDIV